MASVGQKLNQLQSFVPTGKPISLAAAPTAGSGTSSSSSSRARKTRSKKKIAGIVILVVIGIFGGLLALSVALVGTGVIPPPSNTSSSTTSPPQPPQQEQPAATLQPPSDPLSDPQALIAEVGAYMQQQGWRHPQQEDHVNMTRVAAGIVKSRYVEDSAVVIVVVQRPDCWSGSVMGSDNVQTTEEACNTGYFFIPCSGFFGSYSLAMQRTNEGDGLPFTIQVWKGGNLLKQAETEADYGVVSFAGGCSGG